MKQLFSEHKSSVNTRKKNKTIAMLNGDGYAFDAIEGFSKETRITGLTNGKFSLISLIRAVLDVCGKANVIISTWSAGLYDTNAIYDLLSSGKISDIRMILDRSFKTRQEQYACHITDLFSPKKIRTTDTHSKFVLIFNDEWNITIRSSMNLNENKRCENFDLDNDPDIFKLFKNFADQLFDRMPDGIIESREIVDPVFDSIFDDQKNPVTQSLRKMKFQDPLKNLIISTYLPTGDDLQKKHLTTSDIFYEIEDMMDVDIQQIYKAMHEMNFKTIKIDGKLCFECYE